MKVLQTIAVMVFLAIGTLADIKYKRIPIRLLTGFGIIAVVIRAVSPQLAVKELIIGVITGVLLIVISVVTGGQIGTGDGLLFVVLGIYLGSSNVVLLLMALILCAAVAGVLFVARQVKRKDRLPFVPFVLCAYIIQQLLMTGI